jgi:hypothetical protein
MKSIGWSQSYQGQKIESLHFIVFFFFFVYFSFTLEFVDLESQSFSTYEKKLL